MSDALGAIHNNKADEGAPGCCLEKLHFAIDVRTHPPYGGVVRVQLEALRLPTIGAVSVPFRVGLASFTG